MFSLLYIDPGSGSLIVQAIIALVAGAGFFVKVNWYRLKTWLGVKKDDIENPDA